MRIMKLCLDNGEKVDGWIKSKTISTANFQDIEEANLREMYDNEIVLDCESKMEASLVRKELNKEGIAYKEWDTSSRGRHFHLIIEGLQAVNSEERLMYRARVIQKYGTDPAKKNGFIAMENRPHLKTGKYKHLVKEVMGVNKIDMDLLQKIKQRLEVIHKTKPVAKGYDNTEKEKLRRNIKVSDILNSYGVDTKDRHTMCPLGHPSNSKKCLHFTDSKGLWYCFNCQTGGDIYSLVMEKRGCTFKEALDRVKDGRF